MFSKALLNTLLLALVLAANPAFGLTRLPFTKSHNIVNAADVLQHDQARARHFATGHSPVTDQPIANYAVRYTAKVEIGTPPELFELLIDTGSSNTWVGANKPYVATSSSVKTDESVKVAYGTGNFTGIEYEDTVTIGDMVLHKQSIGVAHKSYGFPSVDGILGIGPADLTTGTLSPGKKITIPTVTDSAFSQGLIKKNQIGISFEPTTSVPKMNGELTWGGTDPSKYTGSITWAPITTTSPANTFWGVDASVSYGDTMILHKTAGIVDTGTSLVLLATDILKKYMSATGGIKDAATTLYTITPSQFANLKPLHFVINGETFTLTPNAQIWPRALNTDVGGKADKIYLIVGDNGSNSGSGLDFITGQAFLERFYTVYDTTNKRVGFATTRHTTATLN